MINEQLLEVPKGGRPALELSEDKMMQLLIKRQKMSSKALAADWGVSVSTINRWLRIARAYYAKEESREAEVV